MKILLVDFSWLWNRSLYAFKELCCQVDDKVVPTGAIYGILSFYQTISSKKFSEMYLCLDDYSAYRKSIYEDYKGTRDHGDEFRAEARKLNPDLFEMLSFLGFKILKAEGMEADDIIASKSLELANSGNTVCIYSSDKDMQQLLIHPNIRMANKISNGELLYITPEQVEEKQDVKPRYIRYYRPFKGDSSDNITSAAPRVLSKYLRPIAELIEEFLIAGKTLDESYSLAVDKSKSNLSDKAYAVLVNGKATYIRNFMLMDLLKYNCNPISNISNVAVPALTSEGFLWMLDKYAMKDFKKFYCDTQAALGYEI